MTDTPWTPGPWIVVDWDEDVNAVKQKGAAEADNIAYMDPEDEADARLIAAAPEMAELLKRLSEWDMLYVNPETGKGIVADGPYWQGQIRPLLSRIRGEA